MKPDRFEERLKMLSRYRCQVIPLDDAIDRLYAGSLPDHAVVITIDDGFHSVRSLAVPRLARYSFPATVYVTTYYVRKNLPIFRLVIQYMFWKARKAPIFLNGSWGELGSIDLRNSEQTNRAMWTCIDFGERNCSEEDRQRICYELGKILEVPFDSILTSRAFHLMSVSELRTLKSSNVSVGLHTHRHSFPDGDQRRAMQELADNFEVLTDTLGSISLHFCYPSGIWNERQWRWLDSFGVKSSTTCIPGLNSASTPRHALRRYLDGDDVHSLEFEAALSGALDAWNAARSAIRNFARGRGPAPEGS
jgi:peptidoglycan/xylan/chitin deacetylase (PgdA/CDA1 family)